MFAQSQQIGFLHNQSLTNPAFAGSHDGTLITLSYNQLWGGVQNAPATQIATLSSRLGNNVGFGGAIIQHSKGPMSIGGIQANYAYHLAFGSKVNVGLLNKSLIFIDSYPLPQAHALCASIVITAGEVKD